MNIQAAQGAIGAADHLLFVYPLWLGDVPALLKSFLENLCCGGFAIAIDEHGRWEKRLVGKSARVVVTMGMPALAYRWFYFAHSLKSLERNILRFAGIAPVRHSIIGSIAAAGNAAQRTDWIKRMRELGRLAR